MEMVGQANTKRKYHIIFFTVVYFILNLKIIKSSKMLKSDRTNSIP